MVDTGVLPARCGTCEHVHPFSGCPRCLGAGWDCPGWTVHPDEADTSRDRELQEMLEFDGKNYLTTEESRSILETLSRLEEVVFAELAPGIDPVIVTVHLGGTETKIQGGQEMNVLTYRVSVREGFWDPGIDPVDELTALARVRLAHSLAVHRDMPPMAWAVISDSLAQGERVHVVTGADYDGRLYRITRHIPSGIVFRRVEIAHQWARLLRGETLDNPAELFKAEGLAAAQIAVLHLVLVTRREIEILVGE